MLNKIICLSVCLSDVSTVKNRCGPSRAGLALQAQAMLVSWPPLEPDRAMELLDCRFADEKVREFAIEGLKTLR